MVEYDVTTCRKCGRSIVFIKTKSGKQMPVDYGKTTTVCTAEGEIAKGWVPHFATCPNADDFRKAK